MRIISYEIYNQNVETSLYFQYSKIILFEEIID